MPDKSAAQKTLAEIFEQARGRYERLAPLRELVEIELKQAPEDFGLVKMMGEILFYEDSHEEAVPWLQKAIARQPDDEDLNAELGMSLYKLERYAEALPHLQHTLRRYPKDYDQHMMVGFALFSLGRRREAATHLKKALNHDVDFASYAQEIKTLALAGLAAPPPGRKPGGAHPQKSPG